MPDPLGRSRRWPTSIRRAGVTRRTFPAGRGSRERRPVNPVPVGGQARGAQSAGRDASPPITVCLPRGDHDFGSDKYHSGEEPSRRLTPLFSYSPVVMWSVGIDGRVVSSSPLSRSARKSR